MHQNIRYAHQYVKDLAEVLADARTDIGGGARGHLRVGARPEVRRYACGAARCHPKSTIDPHHRPHHNLARVIEMAILNELNRDMADLRARKLD